MAKVTRGVIVHEYIGTERDHLDAHLVVLRHLDPVRAQDFDSRLQALNSSGFSTCDGRVDSNRRILRRISVTLDGVAPEGAYFGLPSVQSNIAGFWPAAWLIPKPDPQMLPLGRRDIARSSERPALYPAAHIHRNSIDSGPDPGPCPRHSLCLSNSGFGALVRRWAVPTSPTKMPL